MLHAAPDGRNINAGVGSLYPECIAKKVREVGADVGVALDGDADRVILVDETGRILDGDEVIAMSVLRHVKVGVEERDEYLAAVNAARRLKGGDYTKRAEDKARDEELVMKLNEEKFVRMAEEEEYLLTIAADGLGKRSSAYEYRIAGRGGQGITNIDLARGKKKTHVAAAFTVLDSDQIVMVSDSGQIIRCSIDKVSIVGRSSRGVSIFNTGDGEQVVSVSRLRDVNGDDEEGGEAEEGENRGPEAEAAPRGNEEGEEEPPEVDGAGEAEGDKAGGGEEETP